jgi:hypothetical protein
MQPLDVHRAIWKRSDPAFLADLTTPERAVLSALAVHAGDAGCYPSHTTLVAGTGLARSTVIQTLMRLEGRRLITRVVNPPQPTRYTVHLMDRPANGPSTTRTKTVQLMDHNRPPNGHELLIELPKELTEPPADEVERVFQHWMERTGRAASVRLTPKRRQVVRTRLKTFSADDLCRAIDGAAGSEFHMSKPEYADLTSLFRNNERVEQHMERAAKPGSTGPGKAADGDFLRKMQEELR